MTKHKDIASQLHDNSCQWFKGRACHPEPEEISRMLTYARQVILPNYFRPTEHGSTMSCLDELYSILTEQIHRASFQCCMDESTAESRTYAEAKADKLVAKLPEVQQMLFEDVVETYNSDPAASGYDEIILTYPGILALTVYRIAHELVKLEIPLLPRMMTEYAHRLTGVDIHPGAQLGRSLMIDHATGIVIGETAVVGNHVKIYQGVTLGALYFPRDESGSMVRQTKRHPTVEDYVVMYANSTILGGDTVIGSHSVIGSNAWITESVPAYSKVLYQNESVVKTRG